MSRPYDPVLIRRALEIARRFSGDGSVEFVNGILDQIKRERKEIASK